MTPLVHIAMFGWIPLVLYLFSRMPAHRAVAASFVGAWLFLPNAFYKFAAGIPPYDKMSATCLGVLFGAAFFDPSRFGRFRFQAVDIPMLAWCVCPFFSSVANDLGAYDGLSATFRATVSWGLPWYIGRLFLDSADAIGDLALCFFLGGLAYVPFCLYEIRMSPQLHRMLYGFYAHPDFAQTMRMGGYRPMVFMEHGLMLALWMAGATLAGFWLHVNGLLKPKLGKWAVPSLMALAVTTVLVKSMGALGLMFMGAAVLLAAGKYRTPVLALLLVSVPLLYIATRSTGAWDGSDLVDALTAMQPERASSLQFRLDNENILLDKARQRLIFGWGGWGRARVYDDFGEDISVTDGLWIIVLGNQGLFGLLSLTLALLLPAMLMLKKIPAGRWREASIAPEAAMAVIVNLYMIDCLLNAMVNPMYALVAGGLCGHLAALVPGGSQAETAQEASPAHTHFQTGGRTRFL
jgi:hypothetical protein